MSQTIADDLGIRYCGEMLGHAMYNDDHGCGGSFCVPIIHDAIDVANALDAKRKEFENATNELAKSNADLMILGNSETFFGNDGSVKSLSRFANA